MTDRHDGTISRLQSLGMVVDAAPHMTAVECNLRRAFADPDKRLLTTFVNPASAVLARRDQQYRAMLERFDLVLPDGTGIVLANRWLHRRHLIRVSFDTTSLAPVVFRLATEYVTPIVLVGGRPGVASQAREQIVRAYPAIQIIATFDGYRDRDSTLSDIHRLKPRVVIAGMGAGAQEAFLLSLATGQWDGLGFTCGGYLDQLSGGMQYYPGWVDKLNLRFAYRLAKEPTRLWRRYLLEYPEFMIRLGRELYSRRRFGDRSE